MTMEGKFVRAAYNNEGYVILGYQVDQPVDRRGVDAARSRHDGARQDAGLHAEARGDLAETPDGKTIPLPSVKEHREGNTSAIQNRGEGPARLDQLLPADGASRACRIGFFSDLDSRAMPYDQVELSNTRACLGRLYFQIPGGITHGQYWLNVKFEKSLIRVPFRILTEDEEKLLSKNYKDISKQVKDAFRPKK